MAKDIEYVSNLNLQGNQIKNFVVEVVTVKPEIDSLGKAGRLVSYGGSLYVSDGTEFTMLGKSETVDGISTQIASLKAKDDELEDKNTDQDTKIGKNATDISGLTTRVNTAEGNIGNLQTKASSAEADIGVLETWKGAADADISALKTTVWDPTTGLEKVVADHTAAIDSKVDKSLVYTKEEVETKVTDINKAIDAKANSADVYTTTQVDKTFKDYYKKTETCSSKEVDTKINTALGSVYKVKGTVASAELPAASDSIKGDVYNLSDESTYGPAGTNVVCTGTAWDALGGTYDLEAYATKTELTDAQSDLNDSIETKVDKDTYDTKITALENSIETKASSADLTSGLNGKVDKTTYDSGKSALETLIAEKASKVTFNGTAGTAYTKLTVNAEGVVTKGENLVIGDIPDNYPASKLANLPAEIKKFRFKESYTVEATSKEVTHNLGIEWPHVTIFRTTDKSIIYADVAYVDENTITISGNVNLGSITVVVSP